MKIPLEQVIEAVSRDENRGFCLDCGADKDCVEPDAREYRCDSCGAFRVFGAEEILMMGEVSE